MGVVENTSNTCASPNTDDPIASDICAIQLKILFGMNSRLWIQTNIQLQSQILIVI